MLNNSNIINSKKWYKKWWGIILIIFLSLILILIFAIVWQVNKIIQSGELDSLALKNNNVSNEKLELINGKNNYWTGSMNPKITIVEFSDFACPYCANSFPVIREISEKYKDKIKFIFRDFPIIKEYSKDLALGARCAGKQGFFWEMHDKLFLNQGISTKEEIFNLAKQLKIDEFKFKNCLYDQKYLTDIQKDYADGVQLGISGTPVWFINGYMIKGSIPVDIFYNIITPLID